MPYMTVVLALTTAFARVGVTDTDAGYVLACGDYSVEVERDDGHLRFSGPSRDTIGEAALWSVGLADGAEVSSSAASVEWSRAGDALVAETSAAGLTVRVSLTPAIDAVDISLSVSSAGPLVLRAQSPGPLRFSDQAVRRMITPSNGNFGVGLELLRGFFQEQSSQDARTWTGEAASGPQGYRRLLGGDAVQRPDVDEPVTINVTDEGRSLLGEAVGAIDGATAIANRPPSAEVGATALVTSEHGAWLSLKRMGRGGVLWIGGAVDAAQAPVARLAIPAALRGLSEESAPADRRVAVIQLAGPSGRGSWSGVTAGEWLGDLRTARFQAEAIESLADLEQAVVGDERPWAIVNPYGEWMPAPDGVDLLEWADAIARFAEDGGVWVETGGYPLFYRMAPVRTLRFEVPYPAGFSDFQHLETEAGSLSWYRVAPRQHGPWEAAEDPSLAFVPGHLSCGRDDQGPFASRRYDAHVADGETWQAPTTRVTFGREPFSALEGYSAANQLARPLAAKMAPELLDAFRRSVLVYYGGDAASTAAYVDRLPSPSVLHTAAYLKGGFDKEYPDHLPPAESWGTSQDLADLIAACDERGILFVPYTNPTWWCDEPRGPSFLAAGEEPLARNLEGEPYGEIYGTNRGWTITFWDEAVRAANERTRTQFTEEFPVPVLFQDQCGARGWVYDTNPASPSPTAYTEGLISMVEEDSAVAPLSTESGWDRVLAFESQFCGMTWRVVPTELSPTWVRPYSADYPPSTFRPFPLAQALGHESVAMIHHDLGQFVTNDEVLTWTVGLGYGLSYRIGAGSLDRPEVSAWLAWLDEIQKSVCAPMIGAPLLAWEILGGDGDTPIFRATYGDITVTANTTGEPYEMGAGLTIAPHGFLAEGPGVLAGAVLQEGRVAWFSWSGGPEGARLTTYGQERSAVSVPLPDWAGHPPVGLVRDGCPELETGPSPGVSTIAMPEDLRGLAPGEWPEATRPQHLGVVTLPPGVNPTWTQIGPAEWTQALRESRLVTDLGLRVEAVTLENLRAALDAPEEWFAIVNPYGEIFPVPPGASSAEGLALIKGYIGNGGIWWETGGYSFYGGVGAEPLAEAGLSNLGVGVTSGELYAPATLLRVTDEGSAWLSRETLETLRATPAVANRTASGSGVPHLDVVDSEAGGYVSGYRLEGWGWLWRLGGMNPPSEVALPVAVDVLARLYQEPWPEPERDARRFLWRH
ncbi:MAG: hypothetical protein GX134_10995 [candidate division WS1 bacterium]|nr:hypothetical protein [candidate division WS1 bacterium]